MTTQDDPAPATTQEDSADGGRMTILEHLAEFRTRVIVSLIAVAVGAVACWILYPWIFDILIDPYCDISDFSFANEGDAVNQCRLLNTEPLGGFQVRMTVAGYGGVAMAIPVILFQVWRFIVPALYPREKRYAAIFVVLGTLLFLMGAALAYWSVPRALEFLTEIGGDDLVNVFQPQAYLGFVVKMMIAFGVGFEFPIVLVFLQIAGLVHHTTLRRGRHYAIIGIVVLVAVLTPSGDPITLLVLSVPMYLFYEIAIIYGRLRDRRLRRRGEPVAGA